MTARFGSVTMLNEEAILQRRFKDRRPGLELVAIEEAAFPVTVARTYVLAQERKPFALLHEFALRLAAAGVCKSGEMASYLGIEESLVAAAIADQVTVGNLAYRAGVGLINLTDRGAEVVRDAESVRPVHVQMNVTFDRMTWKIADYSRSSLLTKKEARDLGLLVLPPSRTSRITEAEITADGINAMLRRRNTSELAREVVVVQEVRPHTHRYMPAKLLVFGGPDGGDVELSLVVDGDPSDDHDLVIRQVGGPERLGISVESKAERPALSEELESQRVSTETVEPLRAGAIDGRITAGDQEASAFSDPTPTSSEEVSLAKLAVRSVSVFEHRDLLRDALENASRRLLLISPWIRRSVVDGTFISRLELRLRKKVPVTIAYGIGSNDKDCDEDAIDKLRGLAGKYENFSFIRLENAHAKVLICDDRWISTSFNWLSFKGDPSRTYRMEEGTLIQIPGQVTSQYDFYMGLVRQQERQETPGS
jgi:hypothetical protein